METASDVPTSQVRIHPDTTVGPVTLRVADLDRSLRFYEQIIGFQRIERVDDTAVLGVGGRPLLSLWERRGARPVPTQATGLYHFAILVPTRADLGHALRRLVDGGVPVGHGDHLVSEALYISDPDGNGIEIYRDRPRETWSWSGGQVRMTTEAVDLAGVLAAAQRGGEAPAGLPPGTKIGHVHLKVADLAQAEAFFHGLLGFDVVSAFPGALFVSAGGYHHHFGLNTWHSLGAGPAPANTAGLEEYTIVLPDTVERARLLARLDDAGISHEEEGDAVSFRDPWGHRIALTVLAS